MEKRILLFLLLAVPYALASVSTDEEHDGQNGQHEQHGHHRRHHKHHSVHQNGNNVATVNPVDGNIGVAAESMMEPSMEKQDQQVVNEEKVSTVDEKIDMGVPMMETNQYADGSNGQGEKNKEKIDMGEPMMETNGDMDGSNQPGSPPPVMGRMSNDLEEANSAEGEVPLHSLLQNFIKAMLGIPDDDDEEDNSLPEHDSHEHEPDDDVAPQSLPSRLFVHLLADHFENELEEDEDDDEHDFHPQMHGFQPGFGGPSFLGGVPLPFQGPFEPNFVPGGQTPPFSPMQFQGRPSSNFGDAYDTPRRYVDMGYDQDQFPSYATYNAEGAYPQNIINIVYPQRQAGPPPPPPRGPFGPRRWNPPPQPRFQPMAFARRGNFQPAFQPGFGMRPSNLDERESVFGERGPVPMRMGEGLFAPRGKPLNAFLFARPVSQGFEGRRPTGNSAEFSAEENFPFDDPTNGLFQPVTTTTRTHSFGLHFLLHHPPTPEGQNQPADNDTPNAPEPEHPTSAGEAATSNDTPDAPEQEHPTSAGEAAPTNDGPKIPPVVKRSPGTEKAGSETASVARDGSDGLVNLNTQSGGEEKKEDNTGSGGTTPINAI